MTTGLIDLAQNQMIDGLLRQQATETTECLYIHLYT